ncbi:uncharacterized protein [Miscanthus floridulus]|uniref:uncharacterized protein n=1 Tax=Miscanthus floridulus TaxID=154761 RepID=UPI003457A63F
MALRRITPRRRPVLPVPRAFFSSSPPFPPPPPPANGDPDTAHSPSSSPPPNPGAPRNPSSSLFQDIKDRLRLSPTSPTPTNLPRPNPARGAPSSKPSLEDVRRMLGEFRPTGGPPSPSAPGAGPSFMDLLKKNSVAQGANAGQRVTGLDAIRESLKRSPPRTPHRPPTPFLTPQSNIFNPELQRNLKGVGAKKEEKDSTIALLRHYSYEELGKRLGELRPAVVVKDGKEWFSLKELQGRIAKLAELEKQENRLSGQLSEIKNCIGNLNKQEKLALPLNIPSLLNLGGQLTLDYMSRPPQEELLEKYFHPDHMSSEEKMKLEFQRVRDEFKMSENDCGSARVQIAQLTLKIKHLSAVLHKKDKHSRKGLQEMVQKRKKYLKYLRRTDWDSYCLVLSKLGLRDVPEYKAPDYKSKATTKAKSKKSKSKGKKRKMKA